MIHNYVYVVECNFYVIFSQTCNSIHIIKHFCEALYMFFKIFAISCLCVLDFAQ